jgi:hypothetical protein
VPDHLFLDRLNHCIIPYVMLDENATMRLAIPRSTIADGVIAAANDALLLSLLELFSDQCSNTVVAYVAYLAAE